MRTNHVKTGAALAVGLALTAGAALAQQQQRAPREQPGTTLNGKKVTVDYGRPSLNGRTLDALMSKLGPDRVWRAGENQVTTFTTEAPVTIGGKNLAAGKYSLYLMLPQGGDWNLLLNTDPGIPLKQLWAFYARLKDPKELVVIDGASHLFDGKTREVGEALEDLLGDFEQ